MLKAIKAGRSIRIPDERMGEYISLGYTIKDMEGNVIHGPAGKSQKTPKEKRTDQVSDVKTFAEEK
jgi:hypothetical protein